MIDEQHYTEIESYLSGSMSEEAKRHFENRIASNNRLKEEVRFHKTAILAIEAALYLDDKARLTAIENESNDIIKPKRISLYRRIAAAAAVILVVCAFGVYNVNMHSNKALGKAFFASSELETTRSSQGQIDMPYDEQLLLAQQRYEAEDYDGAKELLAVIAISDTELAYKAQWNLLMTQLTDGSCNDECSVLLTKIAEDSNHPYNTRANALQQKMQSVFHSIAE